MPVTSGIFGKLDCPAGAISRLWYNSSTNAATVDVTMCNRGGGTAIIRIAIIPASSDIVRPEDYIIFNQPVESGSTFVLSGVVMSTQETVYVYSDTVGVSARIHGFVNDLGPAVSDIGMATYNNAGLTQYAAGFDITSEDKAATPKLVKAIVDAYGGSGGSSGGGGFTKIVSVLKNGLGANSQLSVPNYIVGANKISVFIDGVQAIGGNDPLLYAYDEVGTVGSISNSITIYDEYPSGTEFIIYT